MRTQKDKQLIFIGLFAIAVNFLTALLGSCSHNAKLYLGVIIYFFSGKYLLANNSIFRKEISFWLFISPIFIFQLSSNVFNYDSTINSLPIHIFFILASLTAFFYVKYSKLILLFLISLIIWFHFNGKKAYLDYRFFGNTKNSYINSNIFSGLSNIRNQDFVVDTNKLIIIDFWNSKCAPCYRQFPLIDSISKLVDTSKIDILLLNIPLKGETKENNYLLLSKFNYSFKQIFANDSHIMNSLKINYFPTTVVIKNNIILFSGEFKDVIKKFKL